MTTETKHELQTLIDNLKTRDQKALDEITGLFGPGFTIETLTRLANERALDALAAVSHLACYIMAKEAEGR